METTSNLSIFLFAAFCLSFITTVVIGQACIKVECGCQFKNNTGTYEISMKNISNKNMHAAFTGVQDTNGQWTYDINPCYGFFGSTQCQSVAMCKIDLNHVKHVPVAKPNILTCGDYEEGKPLQVTYEKYKWKIDGIERQLVINLSFDGDNGVSKVLQSKISNLQRYTVKITSQSLRPRLIQPSARVSSLSNALSIGSILVISFFAVIVIYLVTGILFMKYKKGATGKEVIPNVEFWSSLPGLIKDGCIFSGKSIKDLCLCQRSEYSDVP